MHICNLTNISKGMGTNRVLQGNSVLHALGDPALSKESEFQYREELVEKALDMLQKDGE